MALLESALAENSGNAAAHELLGALHAGHADLGSARSHLERAVELLPSRPESRSLLGNVLKRLGRYEEALAQHGEALRLAPASVAVLSDLASALMAAGELDAALDRFRQAAALGGHVAATHANLGTALQVAGRENEACTAFRAALAIDAENLPALTNLGTCLKRLGQLEEAILVLRRAAQQDPENLDAQWNLALSLLMSGAWTEGWRRFEVRRRLPGFCIEHPGGEAWDGRDLEDGTLLVHAEQGLGDSLQFSRFLPHARRRVRRLVFECQAPLARLFAGVRGVDEVIARGATRPVARANAPLMSLPHLLGEGESLLSVPGPYLWGESDRLASWAHRLSGLQGLKIGIAWQGSPSYKDDASRSIPLSAFAALAAEEGVSLVCLQKKNGLEQLRRSPFASRILDLGEALDPGPDAFVDTLAVLAQLDLVICSDSALAHLAGAAGRPTWLLLPRVPDWRWGLDGDRTPWYPSMRIYRQREAGNWRELFGRVLADLRLDPILGLS